MQKHTNSFKENLSSILNELHLAKQWGSASIIFTVHKTIFSQYKTIEALTKILKKLDYSIVEVEINNIKGNFIETLTRQQNLYNTIFYFTNIGWGGGKDNNDCYRILNLHRETFIENRIKAIFFLTSTEASNFPHYAPDFWAFRHRVLGFATPRAYNKMKPPVGILLWKLENSIDQNINLKDNISNLRNMLNELPDQTEAVATRIETQYELAHLFWQEGDLLGAQKALEMGMKLAKAYNFTEELAKLSNGLAIVYYEQENYQEAIELLESLIKENPRDCLFRLNQAISLFAIKKRYMATRQGEIAANMCMKNAWAWNTLGFLYYFAGKMDKAVISFQKAIDISPANAYFIESLAICYLTKGLQSEAIVQFQQAKNCSVDRNFFHNIVQECILGNKQTALKFVLEAINAGKLPKKAIVRDPILYSLFNFDKPSQISNFGV